MDTNHSTHYRDSQFLSPSAALRRSQKSKWPKRRHSPYPPQSPRQATGPFAEAPLLTAQSPWHHSTLPTSVASQDSIMAQSSPHWPRSPEPPAYMPRSPMIFDFEIAEPAGTQSPVYMPPNLSPSPDPTSAPPTLSFSPPPYIPQSPVSIQIQRDQRLAVPFLLSHNPWGEEQQRPQFYQPQPLPVALVARRSGTPLYASDIMDDVPNAVDLKERMIKETLERWETSIQEEEEARALKEDERGWGRWWRVLRRFVDSDVPSPSITVRPDGHERLPPIESAFTTQISQNYLRQKQQQQQQQQPQQQPRKTDYAATISFQPTVYNNGYYSSRPFDI